MTHRWIVEGARLAYRLDDGKLLRPSAREIWAAEFQGRRIIGHHPVAGPPSSDLQNLVISRFPAAPVLRVGGNILVGLKAELAVRIGPTVIPLPAQPPSDIPDQIVAEASWFPIDVDAFAEAVKEIHSRGIDLDRPLAFGQLIRLERSADLGFELLNTAELDPAVAINTAAPVGEHVDGLKADMYPYQNDGVAFLRSIADESLGCILGDEMGLGKTLQVIALLQLEKNAGRSLNLVVAPATLLENWYRELATFAPSITVVKHAGPNRFGIRERLLPYDVVLCSYETAVNDQPMLSSVSWNVLVLDEAQSIKNPDAQRTTSVKSINRRVSIAVTGTPVENRLSDLWSLADFSLQGLLGSVDDFRTEFDDSEIDASRLAPLVAPILLRRRVLEVAKDLPPRIDIPQAISMTPDMAAAYEDVRLATSEEYGRSASLVSLQRLRMFCTHPRLLGFWPDLPPGASPKYRRLVEILEEVFARDEKALIFTTYNGMADIFLGDLPLHFSSMFLQAINGRTELVRRQLIIDEFAAYRGPGVLVLNPKAAGVGLNITAANHVIHYNPEWNPAVEDQASARAYRRKQTRPVTVHHLYLSDSMEEVVIDRLNFKRSLAKGAVTGHAGEATSADIMRALAISPLSKKGSLE